MLALSELPTVCFLYGFLCIKTCMVLGSVKKIYDCVTLVKHIPCLRNVILVYTIPCRNLGAQTF